MNKSNQLLKSIGLAIAVAVPCIAAVNSPEERQSKIEAADKLLNSKVEIAGKDLLERIGDPFAALPVKIVVKKKAPKPVEKNTLTPQELIPLLANNVKPTGIVAVGGEYILLLPNGRVKSGNSIPVEYLGIEYNLEITSVLRNGYNLRFEGAEMKIKLK